MSECVIGCGLISVIYNRAALVQLHKSPNPQTHTQTITYMKNIITHCKSESNIMEFITLLF